MLGLGDEIPQPDDDMTGLYDEVEPESEHSDDIHEMEDVPNEYDSVEEDHLQQGPPNSIVELLGKEPGKVFYDNEMDAASPATDMENRSHWAPFKSEREFRFAEWVVQSKISRPDVDYLIKLDMLNIPFRSANNLFNRLDDMTFELGFRSWLRSNVTYESPSDGGTQHRSDTKVMHYRNPID
jgi:hypothetical protein